MDTHQIIDRCQDLLVSALHRLTPECIILFARSRIDETNITEIPRLIEILPQSQRANAQKTLAFLRQGLKEICAEHEAWAIQMGLRYGRQYKVSPIDSKSLALEGLYKATLRYKPRGSFLSYAQSWIRQCIQRSVDAHMLYSLDSPIQADDDTTRITQLTAKDTAWGQSSYFARDPFYMEELRLKYCPHLSMDQMNALLKDPEVAELYGC